MTESFPLSWPIGRERTPKHSRKPAAFKTSPGRARDEMLHQLKLLGARDVVISTNVATYRRGNMDIPYADQSSAKEDPGVAVYYTWKGDQYVLACDKWNTVTDNMQALNKTVDAIRGIERWGTGEMMRAAFAGFKALAEPKKESCWDVLQMQSTTYAPLIHEQYRKLVKVAHPDAGGSVEKFQQLQHAYQEALKYAQS